MREKKKSIGEWSTSSEFSYFCEESLRKTGLFSFVFLCMC